MKKLALIFFVFLGIKSVLSQTLIKQTLIPLDNIKGVPYAKDPASNELIVDGFEIDNSGNFYFLASGASTCLAVFSGNKQLYRNSYKKIPANPIFKYKGYLYTYDRFENNLIVLNTSNGAVMKIINHITSKSVNSFHFADSSLVLETITDSKSKYEMFDLNGKSIKELLNRNGIESNIEPEKIQSARWEFLGKWKEYFIFWNVNPDSSTNERLSMVDKQGNILANKLLPHDFSGQGYADNPSEDRKVRNGSLFVLGKKGKNALITEINLSVFFWGK